MMKLLLLGVIEMKDKEEEVAEAEAAEARARKGEDKEDKVPPEGVINHFLRWICLLKGDHTMMDLCQEEMIAVFRMTDMLILHLKDTMMISL